MRPPICGICDKELDEKDDGGLIYFKKRPSDIKWEKKMEKIGGVGHPPYAEWFCKKHYEIASEWKHLFIDEALKLIRSEST
jgi:hypothetical protein